MSSLISDIVSRIKASKPGRVASGVKWGLVEAYSPFNRVIRLEPHERTRGCALVSFHIEPFLLDSAKPIPPDHPCYYRASHWECTEMARSLLELGYAVDVISYQNNKFIPRQKYDVFLDPRHNMQRLAPLLPKECLKIFHIDAAHILFMDAAESQRLLAMQQRRGVTLRPHRFEWPNLGIEYADCATILGNGFTVQTYAYAGKPIYRVPLSTPFLYPWPEEKDFEACRRRFMWLGSAGLVHKGLDLVLEAFAGMPDFHLTVCGPVSTEKDFEQAYKRELYELPNIHTVGWVDLGSPQFLELMRNCVALVYPSCSEGQSGSVISALAGGLIPVISYESGVDVDDFGVILPNSSVNEIRRAVTALASRPAVELKSMARRGWEYARDHHSRDSFAREWRKVLHTILAQHNAPPSTGVTVVQVPSVQSGLQRDVSIETAPAAAEGSLQSVAKASLAEEASHQFISRFARVSKMSFTFGRARNVHLNGRKMSSLISDIGARIKASKPGRVASRVKWALADAYSPLNRVIRLEPHERTRGHALISYYIEPYLLDSTKPIPPDHPYYWHESYWECTEMARSLLELGYAVDVISHQNNKFIPRQKYDVFLDPRHNMQRLAPLLPKECLKIFHIDAAHILFMDAAESQRLLAVQRRRGVTLRPRRFEWPNLGIEYADCATILGNGFTVQTYAYAGKPTYRVPVSTPVLYPWPEEKNFEACRRRFVWLGSGGLVHKGLDLVLEAFAGMPDFHLTVCGPVSTEKDFEQAYKRELYELPNIHTAGWVDLGSAESLELMRSCVALVYPSCSEGQSGGVITALADGLIPIISYESGVDVHDFGMILPSSTVNEIRRAVTALASRPAAELKSMARRGWEYARDHHSRDSFAREWRKVLRTILAEHGAPRISAGVAAG